MKDCELVNFIFSYNSNGTITRRSTGRAVGSLDSKGYLQAYFYPGRTILVHNAVWIIHNGEKPECMIIDHINHNKTDNRIENLRLTNTAGNQRNQRLRSSTFSGFTGVSWHKATQKWIAKIKVDSKDIHLGVFNDINEAVKARLRANEKHCFHVNHGK